MSSILIDCAYTVHVCIYIYYTVDCFGRPIDMHSTLQSFQRALHTSLGHTVGEVVSFWFSSLDMHRWPPTSHLVQNGFGEAITGGMDARPVDWVSLAEPVRLNRPG